MKTTSDLSHDIRIPHSSISTTSVKIKWTDSPQAYNYPPPWQSIVAQMILRRDPPLGLPTNPAAGSGT